MVDCVLFWGCNWTILFFSFDYHAETITNYNALLFGYMQRFSLHTYFLLCSFIRMLSFYNANTNVRYFSSYTFVSKVIDLRFWRENNKNVSPFLFPFSRFFPFRTTHKYDFYPHACWLRMLLNAMALVYRTTKTHTENYFRPITHSHARKLFILRVSGTVKTLCRVILRLNNIS